MAETVTLVARIRRHILDIDLSLPADHGPRSMIGGQSGAEPHDHEKGQVTVLFGPSGAGKTTLLRCLAGLDRPDAGRIEVGGEVWDDRRTHLPTRRRRVGYLFQDHALFPHLSVAGNVGYGLRGVPRRDRPGQIAEALATAGAAHLADRPVRHLSGGEAQRVALARALAPRPRLLLLDEPLSALDTPTRVRLRAELRQVLVTAGVPAIVVTHDRGEALALGDQLLVLIDGRVRQVGPLAEVFSRPADPQVAAAVGVESTLPGTVVGRSAGDLVEVRVGRHTVLSAAPADPGEPVLACVRAEDVALALPGQDGPQTSPRNRIPATVVELHPDGPVVRVELTAAGLTLSAYVTRLAAEELGVAPGREVVAVFKATAVHLVSRRSDPAGPSPARET